MGLKSNISTDQLIEFRHELHRHPEVSGKESETAKRIFEWISWFSPEEIIPGFGGNGLAAIFKGKVAGPAIMFRAELDALPLNESGSYDYRSQCPGAAHLCGHDGHMAILLGLAEHMTKNRPLCGKVILLFQPAEETGTGALNVINDKRFSALNPDYVFAIHNLPGYPANQVIVREGTIAAASTGMIFKLTGHTSHAAEPEKGKSPTGAIAKLILSLGKLRGQLQDLRSFASITIIHVKIGEPSFGTTPGDGLVMVTLRAYEDNDLENLVNQAESLVKSISSEEGLDMEVTFTDTFPATNNHAEATALVLRSAKILGLDLFTPAEPFRWSEDFGHFTKLSKGSLICLGAGKQYPALHHPDYDFPDILLNPGVELLGQICVEAGIYNKDRV